MQSANFWCSFTFWCDLYHVTLTLGSPIIYGKILIMRPFLIVLLSLVIITLFIRRILLCALLSPQYIMVSLKRNTPNILGTGLYFISNVLLNSHYASSLRRGWKLFCDRYIQLHVLQEKAQFHSWLPPGYYKWNSRLYLGNSLILILVMCRTNVS